MKYAGFVLVILGCAAVEAVLPWLFGLDLARPLLWVPLVVFFALQLDTLAGASLSLLAGFVADAHAGTPTGLAAFAGVFLFVLARLLLAALRADGRVFEVLLSGAFVVVYHLLTRALVQVFGPPSVSFGDMAWGPLLALSAGATAALTPPVMWLARRIDRLEARGAGAESRL